MKDEYLEFEGGIKRIDVQIKELRKYSVQKGINYLAEIRNLGKERVKVLKDIYGNLSVWQTVQVARHENRPVLVDYLEHMVKDFREMHGDRCYGDDRAIVCGLGKIGKRKVMVIGHNKRGIKLSIDPDDAEDVNNDKLRCYGGYPNPEGFRKALVKMKYAEKFGIPIVTLIDTPGAYPGIGAEERGQGSAIAQNLVYMSRVRVPVVAVVIGEGGSGGALGIGVGDRLAMLEHSYYSVISPEGCAAILWKDGTKNEEAADALRLTSRDSLELKAIDAVIKEPLGGAHRSHHDTIINVERYIAKSLRRLSKMDVDKMVEKRYKVIGMRASGGRKWGERFYKKKKGFFRK